MVPRIVFDFDGVIHSYRSGWKGETVIPDPPVPGIREVIEQLMERGYDVVIVSARAKTAEGTLAICHWLQFHGLPMLSVMSEEPPALVYVDDRAICFDGDTSTLYEKIVNFKPWYVKESDNENH